MKNKNPHETILLNANTAKSFLCLKNVKIFLSRPLELHLTNTTNITELLLPGGNSNFRIIGMDTVLGGSLNCVVDIPT